MGKTLRVVLVVAAFLVAVWWLRDGWRRTEVDLAAQSMAQRYELATVGTMGAYRLDRYTGEVAFFVGSEMVPVPGSEAWQFDWDILRGVLRDQEP
jgi:hypothetical protein